MILGFISQALAAMSIRIVGELISGSAFVGSGIEILQEFNGKPREVEQILAALASSFAYDRDFPD